MVQDGLRLVLEHLLLISCLSVVVAQVAEATPLHGVLAVAVLAVL
jgi:hypothetical protein